MLIQITTAVVIVAGWLFGTLAAFKIVRNDHSENSALADFVGSLFCWWLMLPVFMIAVAWKGGGTYFNNVIDQLERRRKPAPLRAGAENGLYD